LFQIKPMPRRNTSTVESDGDWLSFPYEGIGPASCAGPEAE
jgi:hypothetical protein